ncbi:MAG: hypothetical protein ACREOO_21840 [bacterium]
MRKMNVVLSLLLVAALGCQREGKIAVQDATRQDAQLLPADVNTIMYCNVRNVVQSPLAQEVLQQIENRMREEMSHDRYEEFKSATGFDPKRDLHSVLAGARQMHGHDEDLYAIVHGQFDEQKIVAFIKQEMDSARHEIHWQEETIGGHRVYFNSRKEQRGLCFVNNTTIYAGSREWLTQALAGKKSGEVPKVFAALENKIRFGDQLWMAVSVDTALHAEPAFARKLRENFPKLETVEDLVFSAHVTDGVRFEGQLQCQNAEDSKLMVDLMRGALAAAKLQVSKDRAAVDALNSIKVDQKGEQALLHGELTPKFFDTLRAQKMFIWGDRHHVI